VVVCSSAVDVGPPRHLCPRARWVFLIPPRDPRGEPVCTLIYSATQHYSRPDVAYVPVPDAELDQVHLASEDASLHADHRLYPRRPASPSRPGDRVRSSGNRGSGVSGLALLELLLPTNILATRRVAYGNLEIVHAYNRRPARHRQVPKTAGNGARWPSKSGCGHLRHGRAPSVATIRLLGGPPPHSGVKLRGKLMRSSGLEPPRAVKPTRPSTSFSGSTCVCPRRDRPVSGVPQTRRTRRTMWLLSEICHASFVSNVEPEPVAPIGPSCCGPGGRRFESPRSPSRTACKWRCFVVFWTGHQETWGTIGEQFFGARPVNRVDPSPPDGEQPSSKQDQHCGLQNRNTRFDSSVPRCSDARKNGASGVLEPFSAAVSSFGFRTDTPGSARITVVRSLFGHSTSGPDPRVPTSRSSEGV
jgi:hypothetical protein